jgi:hypothetical protein
MGRRLIASIPIRIMSDTRDEDEGVGEVNKIERVERDKIDVDCVCTDTQIVDTLGLGCSSVRNTIIYIIIYYIIVRLMHTRYYRL